MLLKVPLALTTLLVVWYFPIVGPSSWYFVSGSIAAPRYTPLRLLDPIELPSDVVMRFAAAAVMPGHCCVILLSYLVGLWCCVASLYCGLCRYRLR